MLLQQVEAGPCISPKKKKMGASPLKNYYTDDGQQM